MDVKLAPSVFNVPGVVVADVVDGSESALGPVHGGHMGDADIALLAIVVVRGDANEGESRVVVGSEREGWLGDRKGRVGVE